MPTLPTIVLSTTDTAVSAAGADWQAMARFQDNIKHNRISYEHRITKREIIDT